MLRIICVAVAAALLSACTYTTAVKIKPGDEVPNGIPVYKKIPVLIVAGTATSVDFIPSPSPDYVIQFGAFLAKNHTIVEFADNGVLTKVDADLDGTIAKDLLDFAKDLIQGVAAPAKNAAMASITAGAPGYFGVFAFKFGPDGQPVGLQPLLSETWLRFDANAGGGNGAGGTDVDDDVTPKKKKKPQGK